jgi:hypothetical protein
VALARQFPKGTLHRGDLCPIGGLTIEIYTIFKAHFKVFLNNFLKNEKGILIVQEPSNLCIWSKF